ncbi:MAG: HAD-IIA family hydrolase [Lachnospiraceae bacterium]|nr:HAD-IIA family hydrolase [Lachnospiraceae bacterium]
MGIPEINQDVQKKLKNITCFALDMDGTVYLGEKWIDGALDFLKAVEDAGKQYVFLTNNSSKNAEAYVEKLSRMGLSVDSDRIVTSGQATIDYLKIHFPDKKVFLLGNELLQEEFEKEGILLAQGEGDVPEVVVTAFDTSLTYAKMCRVCDLVRDGLPYITTHPDYNCPTETGFIPDSGAIHAFIHASAFRYPDHVIGKPSGDIMDYLAKRAGVSKEQTAMVGDRLYTDVAAGVNNGYTGILVLSGEAGMEDVYGSKIIPDLIFESVKHMIPYI